MQFKGFNKGKAILDVGLDAYLDKGQTMTFLIDNHNLLDWYPLDKMAEYRYNVNERTIYLRQNGGTNKSNWPDLPDMPVSFSDLARGVVRPVKKHNEQIIADAYSLFKLPSPASLSSRTQAEEAISKSLIDLGELEEELRLLEYYEEDPDTLLEREQEINHKITLVGTMYRWYSLMRKAF